MKSRTLAGILLISLTLACGASYAQTVTIQDAWIRTSVPGQEATGAFMKITARVDERLVGVSTPAAGVAEVHQMLLDGGVMKMRAVKGGLDLPAGKTVALTPGGYHVMLMDLKAPLAMGSTVPMTLLFKDAAGTESRVELKVPVSTMEPGVANGMGAGLGSNMNGHKH
ncbi:MAG: copper chaperone PCu(A)C [Burkholderiaceae bacterium]|nr:MAG: copper chaperone PCu(A)C [Burkholderiaceae bacterium]TBR76023.1 MAG: copper chaperone PCu(A)C [Burkholderiaceae bacterium]